MTEQGRVCRRHFRSLRRAGSGRLAGVERLRSLLQAFWSVVERGFKAGKLDYQMAPELTAALSAYDAHYPGLAEKVKRDIQRVYLQVEEASFK